MLYLVSYDIPDDRRRTKLAKALKDFGDLVQFSIFECLLDANLLVKMTDRIRAVISEDEDSVKIYFLCGSCERAIAIIGQGLVTKNEDVYIL